MAIGTPSALIEDVLKKNCSVDFSSSVVVYTQDKEKNGFFGYSRAYELEGKLRNHKQGVFYEAGEWGHIAHYDYSGNKPNYTDKHWTKRLSFGKGEILFYDAPAYQNLSSATSGVKKLVSYDIQPVNVASRAITFEDIKPVLEAIKNSKYKIHLNLKNFPMSQELRDAVVDLAVCRGETGLSLEFQISQNWIFAEARIKRRMVEIRAAEKEAEEKQLLEKLLEEKAVAEKFALAKQAEEKLAAEKLAAEQEVVAKLALEKQAEEQLVAEKLAAEQKIAETRLQVADTVRQITEFKEKFVYLKKNAEQAQEMVETKNVEIAKLRIENEGLKSSLSDKNLAVQSLTTDNEALKKELLQKHLNVQILSKEANQALSNRMSLLQQFDSEKSKQSLGYARLETNLKLAKEASTVLRAKNEGLNRLNNKFKNLYMTFVGESVGLDESDQATLACYFSPSFQELPSLALKELGEIFQENVKRLRRDEKNERFDRLFENPEELLSQIRNGLSHEDTVVLLGQVLRGFSSLLLESQDWDVVPDEASVKSRCRS